MNILIPHSWLLEHLETSATPLEIQKYLSLAGPSVERIYDREGEPVYDIEVTTNRVDSMSVKGIAREAAVILTHFGLPSYLREMPSKLVEFQPEKSDKPLPVILNDSQLCRRIMGVVLSEVQHAPTPPWMAKRLLQIDQQVHDSVIDITNYITHELGHPCHAFDYDKIMALGGKIIVKEAQAGKKFTTLDGSNYETLGGEIVFENPAGEIIDLPAIKGTLNTAVDSQTSNILLWIESLEPSKIRFASMSHAIRTVAAQLNEKNVDPELANDVLSRGIELYQELCSAQQASPIYDTYPGQQELVPVAVSLTKIADYLGLSLAPAEMEQILVSLGCEVEIQAEQLIVTPPSFRPDITIAADVIEEIARIYGYHRLPSQVMATQIPLSKPTDIDIQLETKIKHFLSHIGWQEVYTYSLVSQSLALESGFDLIDHLKLQNPLTDDRIYLRRSLTPSLIEVVANSPQTKIAAVYELAYVYIPRSEDLPDHELTLSLVSNQSYRVVKGNLEALLASLFIPNWQIELAQLNELQGRITTIYDDQVLELGELELKPNGITAISLSMSKLMTVARSHPRYQPLPKTAPVIEDLTFTLPEKTHVGEVMVLIQKTSVLITSVTLLDIYQQNFTFTLEYRDSTKNLSSLEIEPVRKQIIANLHQEYQAVLVGQVSD